MKDINKEEFNKTIKVKLFINKAEKKVDHIWDQNKKRMKKEIQEVRYSISHKIIKCPINSKNNIQKGKEMRNTKK